MSKMSKMSKNVKKKCLIVKMEDEEGDKDEEEEGKEEEEQEKEEEKEGKEEK